MNQFKDVFTGKAQRGYTRATSSQKCVRAGGKHNDLENVGRTARHHTFFEMLGNFSFGDYFKADAIAFAYELLTKDYGIDPKRLVYTVHESRRRGAPLWKKVAGVRDDAGDRPGRQGQLLGHGRDRALRSLQRDPLPSGRRHPLRRGSRRPAVPGPGLRLRPLDRDLEPGVHAVRAVGRPATRRPLPKPSVDTGMGLERLCAVLQGVRSNYETDLLRPLIDDVAGLAGREVRARPTTSGSPSVSLRAIADHARAAAFLIADGVFPDKTGREYVLRRIMRRAIYHGWLLGIREPFLATWSARRHRRDGRRLSGAASSAQRHRRGRRPGGAAVPRDARARRAACSKRRPARLTRDACPASWCSSSTTPSGSRWT